MFSGLALLVGNDLTYGKVLFAEFLPGLHVKCTCSVKCTVGQHADMFDTMFRRVFVY